MVNKAISVLWKNIEKKKELLDRQRPLAEKIINNLLEWFKIELTYSSNAIEGNTLSRLETAIVIEKGITIGGKLLKEHLEAINHAKAFEYILSLVKIQNIAESDILEIHSLVLSYIEEYAGRYREMRVRIAGTEIIFPNHLKVPELMKQFIDYINSPSLHPINKALYAHYELVTIHPFADGNGRTARLLMNLILMQYGYPPSIIKPVYRLKYLKSLEQAQLGGTKDNYEEFMLQTIDKSMDIYISSIHNKISPKITPRESLIKIGELAKEAGEPIATVRHWIKLGLIEVSETLESGYQLFDRVELKKCKRIRELQKQRFTLEEIANTLAEGEDHVI